MDLRKVYYYVICLGSLFIFAWSAADLTSASLSLLASRAAQISLEQNIQGSEGESALDVYYQKKILYDRLSDSAARLIISGIVFLYSRTKVNQLEKS
ncbi:MAG: hypothetical protein ACPL4K_02995 [Candidatus Margulisiibacteriota bacterium]